MKTIMMVAMATWMVGCGGDDFEPEQQEPVVVETAACKENVTGRLTLANGATFVQDAVVNGVDYGKIQTGASIDIDLPPGEYSVQFNWYSGSAACTLATATVSVCSTQTISCNGPDQ